MIVSEYNGKTYRPKYHEDLVHCEINLPENAPEEWKDRATLWNSVEMKEKQKNAQLARTLKAALPNDWSYEVAEETVRDYVQRNFVSKGMCADWAIHDSVNPQGYGTCNGKREKRESIIISLMWTMDIPGRISTARRSSR